ncbi:hypothetical protein [Cellulomonas bogoriensis]|uniref:hypothetical protein n=1 Tax=Cellulomonas bogoriensis TaxID=301388 RepID=UPI000B2F9220|nr:hypothetical protein [Cellulomonas bogoriensis]
MTAMAGYDFEVDLPVVATAAEQMADTVETFRAKDVKHLLPSRQAVGHDVLWDATQEFRARWEIGANNLCRDTSELAGRLARVAMSYAELDREGAERIAGAGSAVKAWAAGQA